MLREWLLILSLLCLMILCTDFLVERCRFAPDKASSLRVELFKTYGSSLAGLRVSNPSLSLSLMPFLILADCM